MAFSNEITIKGCAFTFATLTPRQLHGAISRARLRVEDRLLPGKALWERAEMGLVVDADEYSRLMRNAFVRTFLTDYTDLDKRHHRKVAKEFAARVLEPMLARAAGEQVLERA